MNFNTEFTTLTNVRFPVIMAPMFLVSNREMIQSAIRNGIMGVFPSLNFRENNALEGVLQSLNAYLKQQHETTGGSYGVNLIVQRSNPLYAGHLKLCVTHKVPFYITSLGNPSEVIKAAHDYGAKVFCDVTNLFHAEKVVRSGCDGIIAVGQGAGGHGGPFPLQLLIPALKKRFPQIPVVAAGGIATGAGVISSMALGASAVSIGTRFIATHEAKVSNEYKNAVVNAGMDDIVMTERISGTPCAVINTPFVQKIGLQQNFIERWMNNNPRVKRKFKMMVQKRGNTLLEKAIRPGNYKNIWCAGQSVELIDNILSCDEVLYRIKNEMQQSMGKLCEKVKS